MPIFIIEHLDSKVFQWSFLEYRHVSQIVGKENIWFTNTNSRRLARFGRVIPESVTTMQLKNVCLLDLAASQTLESKEAKVFEYYIFGGILGDHPAAGRTKKLLADRVSCAVQRNLGLDQFSTDTAVLVVKKIIEGNSLSQIQFIPLIEVHTKFGESVILPYHYVLENGKPVVAPGLIEMLTNQETF